MNARGAYVSGALAAAAYAVVFVTSAPHPRPFFDSQLPPPPYVWVKPPPGTPASGKALGRATTVTLGPRGSPAFTLATDDGQAIVSMYDGSIATRAGEKAVRVALQPLDAATLAAPPAGKTFASNAYRLTAAYTTSKLPARFASPSCPVEQQPKLCPTLLLRYATSGSALVRAEHGSWTAVPGALDSAASVQFFADIGAAGDFAVVASPSAPPATKGPSALTIVGIALGALAVLAGVFMRLGPRRRRRA